MVLGLTAEMYSYGPQFLVFDILAFIANAIIVERIVVPWIYPLKLVSINEYCYLRFRSNAVRILASLLAILASISYMGMSMYAPSVALESVTGLPVWFSIPSMSLVCIAYTALGGMRAVIWTDVFQFMAMIGGILAILIQGSVTVGGFGNVVQHAKEEGRTTFVDWSPDPTVRNTFWSLMIGRTLFWIPYYGLSQAAVQRYSSTKSLAKARITILMSIPGLVLIETINGLTGLVVLAYYAKIRCDPLKNKEINNENQILPFFVVKLFADSPGFAGLFLAALYGGALSSVSSSLSGSAANCWEDILGRRLSHLPETRKAIINRILVILFGILTTAVAFIAAVVPGTVVQVSIALSGAVAAPLFGVFVLGGISRLANWTGALSGGIVSFLVVTWISIGSLTVPNKYPPLPPLPIDGCSRNGTSKSFIPLDNGNCTSSAFSSTVAYEQKSTAVHHGIQRFYCLSYLWYVSLGLVITLSVGFVVSLIFRDREMEKAVEDRLLIRFRNFCCSWSKVERERQTCDGRLLSMNSRNTESKTCNDANEKSSI